MAAVVDGVPVAMAPPPGYVVDFAHPQRYNISVAYWLSGVGNALALLFVAQLVYVRLRIQKRVRVDDGCLFVAYAFSIALQGVCIHGYVAGYFGTHAWEMPFTQYQNAMRALYLLSPFFIPMQCAAKLTLLLIYQRLVWPTRVAASMVWVVGFIVVGYSFALFMASIFLCSPVAAAWDLTITEHTCINRGAVYQATVALSAITDVLILLVPFPVVLRLRMAIRQKVLLLSLFAFIGIVTIVTSVVRLFEIIRTMNDPDLFYGGTVVVYLTILEVNLYVICATLPTVKVFFSHLFPRKPGSQDDNSKYVNPIGLVTIGGSKYAPAPDPLYPVRATTDVEAAKEPSQGEDSNHQSWDDLFDGDSARAIIATRTTAVEFSSRE